MKNGWKHLKRPKKNPESEKTAEKKIPSVEKWQVKILEVKNCEEKKSLIPEKKVECLKNGRKNFKRPKKIVK